MRHAHLIGLAALALGGCNNGSDFWSGTWLVQRTDAEVTSTSDCTENYDEAQCPTGDIDLEESPWTYTYEFDSNDGLEWVEILLGLEGNYFLIIDDLTLPGTVNEDGDTLTFTFEEFEDVNDVEMHEDGYTYGYVMNATGTETWTFSRDDEDMVSGSRTLSFTSDERYYETDEWNDEDVSIFGSQMPAYDHLENTAGEEEPDGRENTAEEGECSGEQCEITLADTTDITEPFTAWWATDTNTGVYDDLGNSGQNAGFDLD